MAALGERGSVFDCPICLEKLRNPKYLPCLHTFCALCIQSLIDSSILDCVTNNKTISFNCPVCRLVISPPANKISAKEWAEKLPINHQILAFFEVNQKQTVLEVLCDSCRQNGEQVIATIRCQQCKDNLCDACCKFIHARVKAYKFHTFIDYRTTNKEIDTTVGIENCVIHKDKPIEVYCFEHEKLCCNYCLTTIHKECKTVRSLDEIDENELEKSAESCINETKQMRYLTTNHILGTKKILSELDQERNEILKNVAKNIEDIKQRLDFLHSEFQNSFRITYEKETSELLSLLNTLEDFDADLAQSENIASSLMQSGTRKHIFIAMEKLKLRLFSQMESMKDMKTNFKRSKVKWTFIDVIERLKYLTKLGDLEFIVERLDYTTRINMHYNAKEKDYNSRKMGNIIYFSF